jgi:DNA-binding Xre family transcriptional regulator
MSVGEFQSATGLGSSTMTKLRNNECVTTDTLLKICKVLRCELNEVIDLKDESNVKN